jgi:hypothetical protein
MEVIMKIKKKTWFKKNTKRVKLFLSFDPLRTVEGTISIPGVNPRLSDIVNDERRFLSIQDVVVPDGWLSPSAKFVLLNKNEVKAMIEVD